MKERAGRGFCCPSRGIICFGKPTQIGDGIFADRSEQPIESRNVSLDLGLQRGELTRRADRIARKVYRDLGQSVLF